MDGFSVTTHWSGVNDVYVGGFGEIHRHDVQDDAVVSHAVLYADDSSKARAPVISPDGSHVAFLLEDGSIAVMPSAGGPITVLDEAFTHGEAHLDWPSREWIYYLKGGTGQPSGSHLLHRINPWTGRDELVWETVRDDGRTPSGNWRVHVARDLVRSAIRPDGRIPEPYGRIVAFDLESDGGVLRLERSLERFSCSTGIDPFGEFFADGHHDHRGVDIRRWENLETVESIRWEDVLQWGPDKRPTGPSHNRNSWSANSSNWLCVHIGWGKWGAAGANQMLVDWNNQRRIVVTENPPYSFVYDSSGDFWVGAAPPPDAQPPVVQKVRAEPDGVFVRMSEPVDPASATAVDAYAIQPEVEILGAELFEDGRTVALTVESLIRGIEYSLQVEGVTDTAPVPNPVERDEPIPFAVAEPVEGLEVNLGPDVAVPVNQDLLLRGDVVMVHGSDTEAVAFQWKRIAGPASAQFLREDEPETYVSFAREGDYRLSLTARAGKVQASDEIAVRVSSEPTITIAEPAGGEVFEAGQEFDIQWTTNDVSDVRIDFSADDGETWQMVELSVDRSSESWGNYPWIVPPVSTEHARIRLEEYSQETSAVSERFTVRAGQPSLTLKAPQDGEELRAGREVQVRFDASGLHAVRLEYSLDGGRVFEPIATVGSSSERFGEVTWKVPEAWTRMAVVRAAALDGGVEDSAEDIDIFGPGAAAPVDVVSFAVQGSVGSLDPDSATVELGPHEGTVDSQGRFFTRFELPVGVDSAVFELEAQDGDRSVSRVVRVELDDAGPPMEGTGVSRGELRRFLDDRSGVLVFVDGNGNAQKLDFTKEQPRITPAVETGDCANPIISPDGTRIVYGRGPVNQAKEIRVHSLTDGASRKVGVGDEAYWFVDGKDEYAVFADWSAKETNGADGATRARKVVTGGVNPDGPRMRVHDRAMDAGPNRTGGWLGQVYANLWAYDVENDRSYPTDRFFLMDDTVADHQTCNGSMAPDATGRLMTLVIPHDYVRIFSYEESGDRFVESSRFELPPGFTEWEFPEWSTDPGFFTAILKTPDLSNHLAIVKVQRGDVVPEFLLLGLDDPGVTFSHLYLAPPADSRPTSQSEPSR